MGGIVRDRQKGNSVPGYNKPAKPGILNPAGRTDEFRLKRRLL